MIRIWNIAGSSLDLAPHSNSKRTDLLIHGIRDIRWSIGLRAFRITYTPRHTHGEATKACDTRVLVIGSEEGNCLITCTVNGVGIIDADSRPIPDFDRAVWLQRLDVSIGRLKGKLSNAHLTGNDPAIDNVAGDLKAALPLPSFIDLL